MLISRSEVSPRHRMSPHRLLLLALLLLIPPTVLLMGIVGSLVLPAQSWSVARVYRLPSSASYPPPGVSGVSSSPGRWIRQNLRMGGWVVEWRWLPRRR